LEAELLKFSTAALHNVSGQLYVLAALPTGKELLAPFEQEASGPQNWSGHYDKEIIP
jgi:anaerobic glycerol-3-phosphate dehydrogenase